MSIPQSLVRFCPFRFALLVVQTVGRFGFYFLCPWRSRGGFTVELADMLLYSPVNDSADLTVQLAGALKIQLKRGPVRPALQTRKRDGFRLWKASMPDLDPKTLFAWQELPEERMLSFVLMATASFQFSQLTDLFATHDAELVSCRHSHTAPGKWQANCRVVCTKPDALKAALDAYQDKERLAVRLWEECIVHQRRRLPFGPRAALPEAE